ncbi:MAG TPA: hypothetical protein VGX25_06790 [Actinophytocola sp.]|uniref:hypothetical protein n=1 Tax=Actinophytocola sp. TaxID=1872138 RepID=UPI002DDDB8CF|nr:hypothetical protein [Actinophytocola sp.]HEV2779095.1 hypothetical protein [Actinophytocola sp.]
MITMPWWLLFLCFLAVAAAVRLVDTARQIRAANRLVDRILEQELAPPSLKDQERVDRAEREASDGS